ncbi:kelch-like protein 24 [Haliotis asinina]|uniref:kelch-like protein 24 n=1 Tax=Haliotis asinina TaxID=109174 RepID=UPI003531D195
MHAATSWRQQYFDTLTLGLGRLLSDEKHADVEVIIDKKSFKCHKAILIAMSPYFDAMFSSGMRESVSGVVKMEGIESDVFSSILMYIYQGYDVVQEGNAENMLKAASILQMEILQKRCEDFLSKKISVDNCLLRWRVACAHDCKNLRKAAWAFILEHFEELTSNEEIQCLEPEEMLALVKDDDLKSPNEEFVCDAVLRWVEHDEAKRAHFVGDIFTYLRLPLAQPEYLINIKKSDFVRRNEKCIQAIDSAKNFHLLPARRHDYSSPIMCPRNPSDMEDVLVVLSGGETPRPPYVRSTNVLAYSFTCRLWYHLAALPFDPGIEFASCVYDNDIFVTGGGLWQTSLLRYHSKKNKWTHMPAKLRRGRRRHAMVSVGNKLYVLGGYNSELGEGERVQKTVEEYDIGSGEWEESGELQIAVSSVSAAVLGEKILLFGGEKNDKTDTASIQCYDTRTRKTSIVAQLPIACKLSRAVVCDGVAYVVLFDGKVIRFHDNNVIENIGVIKTFERVHFGLIHRQGSLVLLGGQEVNEGPNRPLCDAMMKFDIKNRTSLNMSDRIPSARLLDSCAKITIDKKFLTEEDATFG